LEGSVIEREPRFSLGRREGQFGKRRHDKRPAISSTNDDKGECMPHEEESDLTICKRREDQTLFYVDDHHLIFTEDIGPCLEEHRDHV
jgi:hypothetical protein